MSTPPVPPSWQAHLDAVLLERLQRAPGVISMELVRRISSTVESFNQRTRDFAEFMLRRGRAGELRTSEVPIVHAEWAPPRPLQPVEMHPSPAGANPRPAPPLPIVIARAARPMPEPSVMRPASAPRPAEPAPVVTAPTVVTASRTHASPAPVDAPEPRPEPVAPSAHEEASSAVTLHLPPARRVVRGATPPAPASVASSRPPGVDRPVLSQPPEPMASSRPPGADRPALLQPPEPVAPSRPPDVDGPVLTHPPEPVAPRQQPDVDRPVLPHPPEPSVTHPRPAHLPGAEARSAASSFPESHGTSEATPPIPVVRISADRRASSPAMSESTTVRAEVTPSLPGVRPAPPRTPHLSGDEPSTPGVTPSSVHATTTRMTPLPHPEVIAPPAPAAVTTPSIANVESSMPAASHSAPPWRSTEPAPAPTHETSQAGGAAPIDLERLADQVERRILRSLAAERERKGRLA